MSDVPTSTRYWYVCIYSWALTAFWPIELFLYLLFSSLQLEPRAYRAIVCSLHFRYLYNAYCCTPHTRLWYYYSYCTIEPPVCTVYRAIAVPCTLLRRWTTLLWALILHCWAICSTVQPSCFNTWGGLLLIEGLIHRILKLCKVLKRSSKVKRPTIPFRSVVARESTKRLSFLFATTHGGTF